ncbi:MAG: phosphosulfolactate synthase [Candidatus Zixiibacteriota bacterium]|nr:MAG: phosphosulfolactate synthase [candidate division Zixibacteria bacterium]
MPKKSTSGAGGKPPAGEKLHTRDYLGLIGVADLPPRTSGFDPGYDPCTVESHLEQSGHLISVLKISMACWQVADEASTRRKVKAARRLNVPVCTGGGPFEVAVSFGRLEEYLDLCADIGVNRVEAGEGFTDLKLKPSEVVTLASRRGLEVQFEVGKKHGGTFGTDVVSALIDQGNSWLDAGAKAIVIEARESAEAVGVFDANHNMNTALAERFVEAFGMDLTVFEAPDKRSQFAFMNHFGPQVHLSNVRLEELLRVEIYRRGLHSDAFQHDNLRPGGPAKK